MSQPFDASKSLATLEQDNTVIAVIEMSQLQSKWLVAAVVPGVKRQPLKKHGILKTRRNNLYRGLAVRRTAGPSGSANSPHHFWDKISGTYRMPNAGA